MNISTIKAVAVRKGHRGLLVLRKYSPEILTTVGIVGGVVAAVMASKATLELEPILEDHKEYVDLIREHRKENALTDQEHAKNAAFVYTKTTMKVAKLYAPAVGMGVASIASIVGAHGIMRKRNAALVAAYTVLEKGFNEYKKRVEGKVGEKAEFELRHDVQNETRKNDEGVEEKVKTIPGLKEYSVYARFFDETNPLFQKNPEFNRAFLHAQQSYMNDLLHARGHVFLNEVYDALGIDRTKAGAIVGWVLSDQGDNFIDFGLFDPDNFKARQFVNGHERAILLDFNVDGVIYDKI